MTPEEKIAKAQARQAIIRASGLVEEQVRDIVREHRRTTMDDAQAIVKKYREKAIKREVFVERMNEARKKAKGYKPPKEKQATKKNHPVKGKKIGGKAKFQGEGDNGAEVSSDNSVGSNGTEQ